MESNHPDLNLVALWLRWDPIRWIAGAMAGLFSGGVTLVVACCLAAFWGYEIAYPVKLGALPFLGALATESGFHSQPLWIGFTFYASLSALLGVLFAHFTPTNSLRALTGMGAAWGLLTWIFIFNLFAPSFSAVSAVKIPANATFPLALILGLSMVSVAFFDRVLRGK